MIRILIFCIVILIAHFSEDKAILLMCLIALLYLPIYWKLLDIESTVSDLQSSLSNLETEASELGSAISDLTSTESLTSDEYCY